MKYQYPIEFTRALVDMRYKDKDESDKQQFEKVREKK